MNPIFWPRVNYVVRHAMRPFARFLPIDWHPRVTGELDVVVDEDKRFRLACNPTSFLAKVLFFQGVKGYEYHSVRVFLEAARQSSVFLDVGANIGYYTLLASVQNPDVRVFSFEPLPAAYHYLEQNIRLNCLEHVTLSRLALADKPGLEQFFVSKDPSFPDVEHHLTSTGGFNEALSSRSTLVESFEVETDTLDHFAKTHLQNMTVDLMKLDTEGSESRVLRGGSQVLSEHRPVIFCEVLPGTIEGELEATFAEHDYLMFRAEKDGLVQLNDLRGVDRAYKEHIMAPPERLHTIEAFIR